ncbi:hypothetical protein GOL87_27550 [Sinorhizobium medicae]|nr:hypothetical protein [Sinorhizobium medicae]
MQFAFARGFSKQPGHQQLIPNRSFLSGAALFLTALSALLFVPAEARGLIWVSIVVNCIGQVALALLSLNLRNVSGGGHIYRAIRRLPAAHSLGSWRYIAVGMWVAAVLGGALTAMDAAMAWHE